MNRQVLKLSNWWWLGYPVGVVLFIGLSFNYVMKNSAAIKNLTVKQSEVEAQQKQAEELKTKLGNLKKVETTAETERLKLLLAAAPASRSVWYMVSELNESASKSGVVIKEYQGKIGDVKEASESATTPSANDASARMSLDVQYDTAGFEPLYQALAVLERVMPLIKITKVAYLGTGTEVVIEGAWGPWIKVSGESGSPLPDYQSLSSKVEQELAGFERMF